MRLLVLTGLCVAIHLAAVPSYSADFPLTKFGAVADDAVPDTAAIQAAIDACGAAGGGRVLFPVGTCLSGTVRLRSGVELHFPEGARLKGVKDLDAYAGFLAAEGTPKLPQSRWHGGRREAGGSPAGCGCPEAARPGLFRARCTRPDPGPRVPRAASTGPAACAHGRQRRTAASAGVSSS